MFGGETVRSVALCGRGRHRLTTLPDDGAPRALLIGADLARRVHPAKPRGASSVTDLVVTTLTELGFQVRSVVDSFGEVTVQICTCPLTEVARSAPEVIRGIQQGLIQEVIDSTSDDLGDPY